MYQINTTLDKYLDKAAILKKTRVRPLTGKELQTVDDLRQMYRSVNILIAELITIKKVIQACEIKELSYIGKNIQRMIESLTKQNAKIYRTKCTVATIKPTPVEIASVKKLVEDTTKRIDFLRNTAIAENIELTPIQDYLEIVGAESMSADLYSYFGDVKGIVEANKGTGESLEVYVDQIMDTVRRIGKMDRYKDAIAKYTQAEEERVRRRKEEEKKKEVTEMRAAADDEMIMFTQAFFRSVRGFENNKAIGISDQSIARKINKHGRSGWVILCTYIYHEMPVYRYVAAGGALSNIFANARIFKTRQAAEKVLKDIQEEHPERKYEAVQMQDEESESA